MTKMKNTKLTYVNGEFFEEQVSVKKPFAKVKQFFLFATATVALTALLAGCTPKGETSTPTVTMTQEQLDDAIKLAVEKAVGNTESKEEVEEKDLEAERIALGQQQANDRQDEIIETEFKPYNNISVKNSAGKGFTTPEIINLVFLNDFRGGVQEANYQGIKVDQTGYSLMELIGTGLTEQETYDLSTAGYYSFMLAEYVEYQYSEDNISKHVKDPKSAEVLDYMLKEYSKVVSGEDKDGEIFTGILENFFFIEENGKVKSNPALAELTPGVVGFTYNILYRNATLYMSDENVRAFEEKVTKCGEEFIYNKIVDNDNVTQLVECDENLYELSNNYGVRKSLHDGFVIMDSLVPSNQIFVPNRNLYQVMGYSSDFETQYNNAIAYWNSVRLSLSNVNTNSTGSKNGSSTRTVTKKELIAVHVDGTTTTWTEGMTQAEADAITQETRDKFAQGIADGTLAEEWVDDFNNQNGNKDNGTGTVSNVGDKSADYNHETQEIIVIETTDEPVYTYVP